MSEPLVELRLPSVLKVAVGTDRVKVRGNTLSAMLEAAYAELPQLRHHLSLEDGSGLRPHVLLIVNGESVLREEVATRTLAEGDEVWVHQAISGG
ncbi:MAG: MoaD/ThiS family protein [Planctomycetota bacterium]